MPPRNPLDLHLPPVPPDLPLESLDPVRPGTTRNIATTCPKGGCPARVPAAYDSRQAVTFFGRRNVDDGIPRKAGTTARLRPAR